EFTIDTVEQKGDAVMPEKDTNHEAVKAAAKAEVAGAAIASVARAQRAPELQAASTPALMAELATQAAALAKKEIELAKVELRQDLHQEVAAAGRLGIAALAAFIALNLLLVT